MNPEVTVNELTLGASSLPDAASATYNFPELARPTKIGLDSGAAAVCSDEKQKSGKFAVDERTSLSASTGSNQTGGSKETCILLTVKDFSVA